MSAVDSSRVADVEKSIESYTRLISGQIVLIGSYEAAGSIPPHALERLAIMRRARELLYWHRALLLWRMRGGPVDNLDLQPVPDAPVPESLLTDICTELGARAGSCLESPRDTVDLAVRAALRKHGLG